MEIRKFTPEDTQQVLEICREVRNYHIDMLGGYYRPLDDVAEAQTFLVSLSNKDVIALVADEDGVIEGYLLADVKVQPHLRAPKVAHISNFGVRADVRHQGIGKKLMDAFFDLCRQEKVDEVKLGVCSNNQSACRFYEKYGFEEYERRMHVRLNRADPIKNT